MAKSITNKNTSLDSVQLEIVYVLLQVVSREGQKIPSLTTEFFLVTEPTPPISTDISQVVMANTLQP